jgi:pimeloyl-ACP methyl ester carboxylesterase
VTIGQDFLPKHLVAKLHLSLTVRVELWRSTSRPLRGRPTVPYRLAAAAVIASLLALVPGCATLRPTARAAMPAEEQGVVFIADGSGNLRQVSDCTAQVLEELHAPLRVQRVNWTHGQGRVFADLYDCGHQKAEGQKLLAAVLEYRRLHPCNRICLVGYSSGAGVILAAADALPPNSVDRIVLLSASVYAKRDLRPALRASREGIDSFHSEWDTVCLTLTVMGMADGWGLAVAGRSGFSPVIESAQDQQLYQNLRQHSWCGPGRWGGHDGSHFGCINCDFLRVQVVPLILNR